jgi:hypothetical protein
MRSGKYWQRRCRWHKPRYLSAASHHGIQRQRATPHYRNYPHTINTDDPGKTIARCPSDVTSCTLCGKLARSVRIHGLIPARFVTHVEEFSSLFPKHHASGVWQNARPLGSGALKRRLDLSSPIPLPMLRERRARLIGCVSSPVI